MPAIPLPEIGTRFLRSFLFVLVSLVAGLAGTVAAACPNWSLTGQQISYTSDQLWVPQTLSVVAGGQNNLRNCSMPGHGYVATAPDFDLTFASNGVGRDLEIRANANCDTVLLVNAANGQWYFDDDGGDGLNSRLRIPNAPEGVYDIWIGTYGPSTCQATMTLETFGGGAPGGTTPPAPQGGCPNPGLNGQMISYDGQGLWVPQQFAVVAGGNLDLRNCSSVPGHGHIIQSPDFTLNFTANPQNYELEFRVDATCDSVLLVNDANGQWHFDDDGGDGLNSRLRIAGARPGLYDVWVGTYGGTNCNATLIAETFPAQVAPPPAAVCPDPGQNGQMLTYDGQGLWVPQQFAVVAGGNVNLRDCASVPGHGYIIQRPDFTLNFTANPQNYALELRTDATCDSILLVNDANGQWHFDDDGGDGLNSRLRIAGARPGLYDVWIGTYGGSNCNATLIAETFPAQVAPPPAAVCPDPGQNGQMLTYDGQGLWVPQRFAVVAGGNVNLRDCASVPGHGYIIQRPDFTLNFTGNPRGYALELRIDASCDPVLLVNDANGQWHFNDDADGLNSRLRIEGARPGLYDVWVGTYGGSNCNATLIAETFPGQGMQPPPQPQPVIEAAPGNMTAYRGQNGQTFTFQVTGASGGSVWGSGVYTDDSSIARAAVHAGLVQVGQTAVVQVQVLPGQQSYEGSNANGVQSSNYGSWSGSYQFVRAGGGGGQAPAVEGQWSIDANGWSGTLHLTQGPGGWSGTVHFDAHGVTETLQDVTLDPVSGMVTFTRPIQGATQMYRGTVAGDRISGQFSQGGGAFSYAWSATRMGAAAPGGGGGAGQGK